MQISIYRNHIIGLDPASVDFPLESLDTRLDTTDALFVDVIHTNIAFINATGHADFYPNVNFTIHNVYLLLFFKRLITFIFFNRAAPFNLAAQFLTMVYTQKLVFILFTWLF